MSLLASKPAYWFPKLSVGVGRRTWSYDGEPEETYDAIIQNAAGGAAAPHPLACFPATPAYHASLPCLPTTPPYHAYLPCLPAMLRTSLTAHLELPPCAGHAIPPCRAAALSDRVTGGVKSARVSSDRTRGRGPLGR